MYRASTLPTLITLAFLAACSGASQTPSQAIDKFVAAEDGGFIAERGDYRGEVKGLKYYETTLQLPDASNCAIYTASAGAPAFGTCDFLASGPDEARHIYEDWERNTSAALPAWKTAELSHSPDGHLATFEGLDPDGHAVYLYIARDAGRYRVTETFGTTRAFASKK